MRKLSVRRADGERSPSAPRPSPPPFAGSGGSAGAAVPADRSSEAADTRSHRSGAARIVRPLCSNREPSSNSISSDRWKSASSTHQSPLRSPARSARSAATVAIASWTSREPSPFTSSSLLAPTHSSRIDRTSRSLISPSWLKSRIGAITPNRSHNSVEVAENTAAASCCGVGSCCGAGTADVLVADGSAPAEQHAISKARAEHDLVQQLRGVMVIPPFVGVRTKLWDHFDRTCGSDDRQCSLRQSSGRTSTTYLGVLPIRFALAGPARNPPVALTPPDPARSGTGSARPGAARGSRGPQGPRRSGVRTARAVRRPRAGPPSGRASGP